MDPLVSGPQDRPEPLDPTENPEELALAIDPEALAPGDPGAQIRLGADREQALEKEIDDFLNRHDLAMRDRIDRERRINDAYNLVVDPDTVGPMPMAQRMVSEMIRTHVNISTSRIKASIFGSRPIMLFEAEDDQADDPATQEAVEEAQAAERFFDPYFFNEMKAKVWLPMAIHRANKLGASIVRVRWVPRTKKGWYRGRGGKWEARKTGAGRIEVDLIPNHQTIVWPLHGLSIRDCQIVGHDSYETPASFRALSRQLELDSIVTDLILSSAQRVGREGETSREVLEADAKGKDLDLGELLSFPGEVRVTELWLQDYVLPGEDEPGNYQLFFYRPIKKLLWLGNNAYRTQQHHYFLVPHSREDNSIWPSGIGHELMYAHRADSAMWNLLLDNLKVVGNVLRIVRSNTLSEAHQDEIFPGGTLVVEKMEDFDVKSLGGDLSWIIEAMRLNQQRGMQSSSVSLPEQGFADPVLKSGASPGSIAQLRESSGKRFSDIDENMRDPLAEICLFTMELLQQYAPADLFFSRASQKTANLLIRQKYTVPNGDLRHRFRIRPKAPSATSNKEVMLQRLMITFQQLSQYIPFAMQYAQTVLAQTNPAGAQQFQEALMQFMNNEVLKTLIENQEISGLGGKVPKLEDPTPIEQQLNEAYQVIQQLQQQIQQIMAAQQPPAPQEAVPGGAPMGPVPVG